MRLTYILAVVVAATFHTSVAAFSPVQDSKAATENGAAATVVDSAEGGRLLRRVDDDSDDHDDDLDDDSFDEERGFAQVLEKVNPVMTMKIPTKAAAEQSKKMGQIDKVVDGYLKHFEAMHGITIKVPEKLKKAAITESKEFDRFVKSVGKLRKAEKQRKAA